MSDSVLVEMLSRNRVLPLLHFVPSKTFRWNKMLFEKCFVPFKTLYWYKTEFPSGNHPCHEVAKF